MVLVGIELAAEVQPRVERGGDRQHEARADAERREREQVRLEELADPVADAPRAHAVQEREVRDVEVTGAVARRVAELEEGVDREQPEDHDANGDELGPRSARTRTRTLARAAAASFARFARASEQQGGRLPGALAARSRLGLFFRDCACLRRLRARLGRRRARRQACSGRDASGGCASLTWPAVR